MAWSNGKRARGSALVASVAAAVVALTGCGGPAPQPMLGTPPGPPAAAPPPETEYHLKVGDELRVLVVGQEQFSGTVKVRPDGRVTAPGAGEYQAAGQTIPELTATIDRGLRRLVRYPDVTLMLTSYAEEVVYVFGEVRSPGAHAYLPDMTALHALGAAAGPEDTGKLSSVMVLRRTGPQAIDIYRIDLDGALDGDATARDLHLRPYDIVFVPRTLIAEVNLFVDKFIRQNVAPFTGYIEGWRALHMDRVYWTTRTVTSE